MNRNGPQIGNNLSKLIDLWHEYVPFVNLKEQLEANRESQATVTGLNGSSTSILIHNLIRTIKRPILVVAPDADTASDLYEDLSYLSDDSQIGHFPSRQILPYDFKAPVGEVMGRRISTLHGLICGSLKAVICPVRALMEPTADPEYIRSSGIRLQVGDEIEMDDLVRRILKLGFRRVPNVEEVGDLALRGGSIDFFSPGSDAPIRVDFFGDEIETIRRFEVATQRTISKVNEVSLLPRREIPITEETLEAHFDRLPSQDADYIRGRYLNDPELPGLEWMAIMFGIKQGSLLDYFDHDGLIYLDDATSIQNAADDVLDEGKALYQRFRNRLTDMPTPDQYYNTTEPLFERIAGSQRINRTPFRAGKKSTIDFGCKLHPSFGSRLDLLGEALKEYQVLGTTYVIATDTEGQASRLGELITEKTGLSDNVAIEVTNLKSGFTCPGGRFARLTDHEIFARYHRRVRRKRFKEGVAISDYSSLTPGDFVVHSDYGIARYMGLKTLTVDKRNRDCLELIYAEESKVYVPVEEFSRVSKYSSKDTVPTLTQLGGTGWEKLKKKTSKAIADMAEDLTRLYAERKSRKGFSFGEDTVWLKQMEASFAYEETPDQLKAINDVKRDMTDEKPMDRLICGDVGFGKTEVAVRAAFKAIEAGKQVAVLVPTTILAQQHHQTFSDRLKDFPVRIGLLSRFRTRKEQEKTVEGLINGRVDLVIGTHRLFSKDVAFSDLGLLIIDEEQRFGVSHKEKLRQIKAEVDTISMTATPIPRTLQLSLMGARDMSLITTSPKDRLPIITEIVDFDPITIATTILREINRGGQVFFVHNRVQTIDAMHGYLKKQVPQAEIVIAHGQMHERSLEGVMHAFMSKRFNVLLCTSIIESGLDIPAANTIIVNRADRFGLAQLYQIRGRVGRSDRRAYAYLMTPPMKLLKADAVKRLRALEAHSDLGSGFALAMRDLEIRGAGTILGAKQSGFIEEIGFDLYNKLLEEAVAEIRGHTIEKLPETKFEADVEMYLPNEYIHSRQQKVDVYRRLADCRNLDQVERIRDEVIDRFGTLPESGERLFDGAAVKISASLLEIEKVKIKAGIINLFFAENRQLKRSEVEALRKATDCPMQFSLTGRTQIILDLSPINEKSRLGYLRGVLGKV